LNKIEELLNYGTGTKVSNLICDSKAKMMRNLILYLFLIFPFMAYTQKALSDEQLIRETLLRYLNGRNNGDTALLASAFHPTAELRYMKNNSEYTIWPIKDYVEGSKPGITTNCISRIISIDICGTAAQAKIELEYPQRKFADYINLLKMDNKWLIAIKTFSSQRIDSARRILFVLTSHEEMGNTGRKTGLHLGEVSHAYKPLVEAGFEIDFVSPKGGSTRMYGADMNDSVNLWFVQNPTAYYRFIHAAKPEEINPSVYTAIYFVGGHGSMWDFPDNTALMNITCSIYERKGIVAAVCHGPAGLVNVKLSNGEYLVKGKQLTAFANNEEKEGNNETIVPFLLQSRLTERGGLFKAAANWQANVITDGRLITGQNPASAKGIALEIIKLIN
jgi:putative intracellular protease/amidase